MIFVAESIFWVLIFFMGASIFSFLNVVIYRVPRKMSFVKGHSICPNCNTKLKPWDLIPVVSFLFLGGKCRYCKSKIAGRDTVFELLGGALFIVCMANYEKLSETLLVFAAACILLVVAGIDADTMEIPNILSIMMAVLGLISIFVFEQISIPEHIIGAYCISIPMLFIVILVPGGFGGGDIKLMAAAGFLCGWKWILLAFFIAIVLGGGYGIFLLASQKKGRKDHFAFGPFLCIGIMTALLFGEKIISWYIGFFPQF